MGEIRKIFQKFKWGTFIAAIAAIALGIIFVVNPDGASDMIFKISGIAIIVLSAALVVDYFIAKKKTTDRLALAVVLLLLGIYFVVKSGIVMALIGLFFGLILVFDGVKRLLGEISMIKSKARGWWIFLALSLLTIALGVFVMFGGVMLFLGIALILDGVSGVVTMLWLQNVESVIIDGDLRGTGDANGENAEENENAVPENDFGEMDETKDETK